MLYKNIDELYAAREKRKKAQSLNVQSALLNYIGGQVGRLSAFDDDAMKYASTGISGNFKNYDKETKSGAFQWDKKKRDEYEQKAKTNWQAVKELESIYLNNKDLIDANYGTQIADLVSNVKSYEDLYDSIRQKNSYFDSIKSPVEGVSSKTWYEYANQYSDASFEDLRKKASLLEGASRRRNLTDTEKELITAMKFDADQKEERHKIVNISPKEWKKKIKALEKEKGEIDDEATWAEDIADKYLVPSLYNDREERKLKKNNEIIEAKAYYNASLLYHAEHDKKEELPPFAPKSGLRPKISEPKSSQWIEDFNAKREDFNAKTNEQNSIKWYEDVNDRTEGSNPFFPKVSAPSKEWKEAYEKNEGYFNPLDFADEDIANIQKDYDAILDAYGKKTANEWLENYIDTNGLYQKAFEDQKKFLSENYIPVVSEASTLLVNFTPKIVTDAFSLASMGASALAGEEWKPNNWWNSGAYVTEALTESMRDRNSSEFGKQAFDLVIGLDNLLGSMYGTSAITGGTKQVLGKQGKNIVTRSLKSALSDKNAGNIMGGLMSTSAAAGTTREAISRGVDTRTALAYGMVNGAIEFLTEKIGYDRLMGIMGSDTTKTALTKEIAKHFGAEALEGATSTALDYVADRLINGEMSKYSQNIQTRMANGESYQEALANANSDLGKEILIGAIQEGSIGAIMGGGGAVVARNITRNMYGTQITNNGAVDILVDQANKLGVNTRGIESPSANMTEAQQDKYFNKVGKVYEQTLNEMVKGKLGTQEGDAIFKDTVKSRLEVLHSDNIEETAVAIQKQMNGKKLTENEKALLETKQAKRVVSEIENSNDDRYDSDWAFAMESAITNAKAESQIKAFALSLLTSEKADVQKLSNIINNETEQNDFANTEDINVSAQNTDSFLVGEEFVEGRIKSIKTDKEGNISVVFEGVDEAVPLANTELSEQNAELIAYAREFGVDAEIMYEAFKMGNTENVGKYALAFRYVYDMADKGATESYLRDSKYSQYLNDAQFNVAYKLGETKAENVKDTAPEFKKMTKVGTLTLTEDVKNRMKRGKINKRQISSIYALRSLTDALGINIVVYQDKITVRGITNEGADGFFDPKTNTIYLEINAGKDATDKTLGEYAILRTLSHELTHFIAQNSPEQYKILQRFVFSHLDEYKGKTLDELINKEMEEDKSLSPEGAAEEVVARACEMMLQNSSVVEVFAYQNPSLAKKMGNFISNFKKNVYKALEKIGAKSEPAKAMKNYLDELQEIWDNALAKAVMNYHSREFVEVDAESQSVAPKIMKSRKTWTESKYHTEVEKSAVEVATYLGISPKKAKKYIRDIEGIAKFIANNQAVDFEPQDPTESMLKKNSDYKWTIDVSTLCAKRLIFTGTYEALQKKYPNFVFTAEDMVRLRELMKKYKFDVACGICYVESTRKDLGVKTQTFIDNYKASQRSGNPITRTNTNGKVFNLVKTAEEKKTTTDKTTDFFYAEKDFTPTIADFTTDRIFELKKNHPLVYEAYMNAMNALGQSKPKLIETRTEYKGEILQKFKKNKENELNRTVKALIEKGGLRLQSFSDFEVPHLLDMMQVVFDMAQVGLTSQAYTKVPEFAEIFGNTGIKINLSLIARGEGIDENGNLIFDDIEGIPHEKAFELRAKYSKNVGTILVGKNDVHIRAALKDARIDFIIPFHKSSWKEALYEKLGLMGYSDYTEFQNEKATDRDVKNYYPLEYWDFNVSGDVNAMTYLQKCYDDKTRIPKFIQFAFEEKAYMDYFGVDNLDNIGNKFLLRGHLNKELALDFFRTSMDKGYLVNEGYWKTLGDFKMYDNDGVGAPQETVSPDFNMEAANRIIEKYNKDVLSGEKYSHKTLPIADKVVDEFSKEIETEMLMRYGQAKKSSKTIEDKYDFKNERKSDSSKSQKEMDFLLGYYKALSKETQGKLFTKTSIEGIAKDILKKNESTYNKFDLMTDIQNVYAMIVDEKGGKVAYNDVFNELLKVSDKVYANIRPSDIPQENKDILNTIRAQKIYLSPEMVSEGVAYYGSKSEFSKAWRGKIRFTYSDESAISFDDFLSTDGKALGVDSENPIKDLIDLYNKNYYVEDQFGSYYEDEIKEEIATDIYESFGHAVAVASHSDALMRRYQKLSQKTRELYQYKKADVFRKVQSKVSMLQTLLVSNNKNKHVPDALKLPLGEFLERLDFSSRSYLNEGDPTDSDIEFFKSFAKLKEAMKQYETLLKDGEDINVSDLDVAVSTIEAFDKVYEELAKMPEGEIKLKKLSLPALQSLNSALYSLRVSINKANALYDESRKESVSGLAQQMNNYLLEFPEAEENLNWLMKQLKWNNLLPVYAFDLLGDVGKTLYKSLTKAENVRQDLLVQLQGFMKKTYTPTEQKHWQEKVQTYNFGDGNTLQLRDSDAMYLWTLLNRESMTEHASVGGLGVEQRKIKRKTFIKSQRAKIVDPDGDYAKRKAQIKHAQDVIGAKLSERQKKVATEIQRYMSDECAKQGNYVSQARWGISTFLEKAYMPARVEYVNGIESQIRSDASNTSIYALLNPSFTKPLVEGANTVLLAQDIFDVFVEHAMNMATYRAYALPLLDMTRIMNFSRNVDGNIVGVQKSLKKAYGNDGQRYFREFLQNLNGKSDSQEIMARILGGLLRAGKAVGTGANLRVAFLQSTAAVRASAELGDWAITKGMVKGVTKGNGYSKATKYSAFAKVKEMGSYGVNLSTPIAKRLKNQTSIRDKAIDKSFALAKKGDQFLFNIIWNACEHVTAKESKLQVGSEEWYRECAARFDDVIARTQVVDSPLTKSPAMNSKSIMDMTTTAFMSEPTVTNNVLFAPLRENEMAKKRGMPAKQRMRKFIKPALVSLKVFTAQAMIVSLVESLWDDWRDDEKEEELHVRLWEHFVQNMYENINPIRNVPLGNTLMEKLDGLILSLIKDKETKKSVEKVLGNNFGNETILDTTIADIFSVIDQASKIITKEELVKEDWMNLADAATKTFSLISGVPFSGVLREVTDLYNNIIDIVNADEDLKWSTKEKTETEKADKFFEDYEKAVLETKKVKEVKSLVNELLKEEVKKAKKKGKEKPVDYAYSQIRAKFTRQYKELYQEAYAKKDTKEMNRIYRLLEASGVYTREKTYGLSKATEQWKEDYKEALEEKKRAENYKK